MAATSPEPSFAELYTPKLVTIMREGYGLAGFKADAIAGLTVAIVALPLSMAIAIASGVTPDRGLYTSIVGGFIVSAFGGSRFQIGGPAGAFIVLVAACVAQHGLEGLLLATFLSGFMLAAIGLLRLGTFIKYIPYPVTVGFTAGIAVIIFSSQIKDLLGLSLEKEPGPLLPKLAALAGALPSVSPAAVAVAAVTIGVIVALRRLRPHWPSLIIGVAIATVGAALMGAPVETIGTRFGGIPQTLPLPHLPEISWTKIVAVLPNALSFTLLGCIESLLSAVVADSMTGRRHRSNCELVAQGLANIASPLFGGICVTGNIARTATNVRSGARGPVAGMLHSVFLLLFMLVAAPLAAFIPLAALAGVLAVVAWNMAEKHEFATLIRASRGDAVVLLVTFLLVIFEDLTVGIVVGFSVSALLFLHRMAESVAVENAPMVEEDRADTENGNGRKPYDSGLATDPDIMVLRISGAFFFGAAAAVGAALDRIGEKPKTYVIDLSAVSLLDSTGAATIESFVRNAHRRGATVRIAGATRPVRRTLLMHGVGRPKVRFIGTVGEALSPDSRTSPSSP
ncbi:SulP family inorganic anion transporter [Bosea sp. (in: a-proteobacteria)]|uniref:SulP family inorganic anion transporter n=1 Tax=Bosea sp. (in: a-proteobacteria) TaxID=1871050 RepID=UPI00262F5BFA|nr:SulP family inorganic anion transporter [Bosea sp. (in: a-proteobacteria)]MCO5091962.1 SulP family inorganic anion transporter [Bosea sp. (in: a-proteobacteria)]